MRWKKLGKIFDPTEHALPHGCAEYAQAPQALVFDDFVRIYFSTRMLEHASGKYVSHIAYVDMQPNLRDIIAVSAHTVIAPGKLGCFDEHGIFPMNVVRHAGRIYGYTSGVNRRQSVPADGAIGLAVSDDDGATFQRLGDGPVLAPSLHEPCIVVDPFVMIRHGVFHMWYVFGLGWKPGTSGPAPDRVYKIGHAVSDDGIHWKKEEARQILDSRLGPDECQALPTVIEIDGRHHMFFCYRQASDFRTNAARGYRIGHAWSDDLRDWARADDELRIDVGADAWDSEMMCYPHVFEHGGQVYMLYNGNRFGRDGFGLAVLEQGG